MLKFTIIGLFQGAVYGLLAVGLVLVYKGTRVFNFAQGEFGTVAAYTTWAMYQNIKLPYLVAVAIGLVAAVALGLIVERLVIRPLLNASKIALLVATVGVALFIISLTILFGKPEPRYLEPLVQGDPLFIFGAGVIPQQVLVAVALAGLAVVLAIFFRTDRGLAILATSQDPLATQIVGISVPGMSRFIWAGAALLGGIAGILQAPITIFTPGFMTSTSLVPAFVAAVLGGMTSLPGAFIGGLMVGVAQNALGIYLLNQQLGVPGGSDLAVFAMLLLVLMIRPQGLLGKEA